MREHPRVPHPMDGRPGAPKSRHPKLKRSDLHPGRLYVVKFPLKHRRPHEAQFDQQTCELVELRGDTMAIVQYQAWKWFRPEGATDSHWWVNWKDKQPIQVWVTAEVRQSQIWYSVERLPYGATSEPISLGA